MISYIHGILTNISKPGKDAKILLVEVLTASGVGYQLNVSHKTELPLLDGEVSFYTTFIVREDSQALYGFSTRRDRAMFGTLMSVSGVGPKVAMSILTTFSLENLHELIVSGNFKEIAKAPGLGPKGAKKIILELQGELVLEEKVTNEISAEPVLKELGEALKSLGYIGEEFEQKFSAGKAIYDNNKSSSIEELLKAAILS